MRTLLALIFAAFVLGMGGPAFADPRLDETPRIAVMTAMTTEMAALEPALTHPREVTAGRTRFLVGELEGRPVVLFLSGVSMVNAAMTTQLALDRFNITAIVFSGVAGGVDPALQVGDVVVAEAWGPHMETWFTRETAPGQFAAPPGPAFTNYGMIYPHAESVVGPNGPERRFWFPADPALLAVARRTAADTQLARCTTAAPPHCLARAPRIVVGGQGVSASVFLDNAAYRDYLFATFQARAVDMESAAVAQVAYVQGVPFIAFRSLSDLAGGDPGVNQFGSFVGLAAANAATTLRAFLRELPPQP
jgi:adenosylhomocysteine nucleosidase